MVGGKVKEVVAVGDKLWINVQDVPQRRHHRKLEECAIYVQPTDDALKVRAGDALWWQGRWAMWTPKNRSREDVRIPRIGYSGVKRPRVGAA